MNEDKSSRYHRLRRRADLGSTALAGFLLLVLVVSGAAVRLREAFQFLTSFVLPAGLEDVVVVALMTVTVLTLLQAVEFPFSWFQGFVLEHRYGLSLSLIHI